MSVYRVSDYREFTVYQNIHLIELRYIKVLLYIHNYTVQTLTEQININFLKIVGTTKLVELMMNFIVDQSFIIVCSIVLDNIKYWGLKRIKALQIK